MAPLFSERCNVSLEGRVIAITGANTGIGKETATELSKRGARLLLLCRNLEKAQKVAHEITEQTSGSVECFELDLGSLKSIRECARKLLEKEDRIDILVNNAGVFGTSYSKTEDGFELHFGVNHLGHFLLTHLLMPLIKNSGASGFRARIVILSSAAHESGSVQWDDLNCESRYHPLRAYSQSKLANVLHGKELAARLVKDNVSVYSLHPGVIKTEIFRHVVQIWWMKLLSGLVRPFLKSPKEGAQTTLYCCLDEKIAEHSGRYYSDCKEKQASRNARDDEAAKKLWEVSLKMVGLNVEEDQ